MAKPIIPWMGGKRRLSKSILPLFPDHKTYVEPFCGGAALFFMKEQSRVEVINDINSDLVNLYRVVQNHLEEFVRQFKYSLVSREVFNWVKEQSPDSLTDIQRAARFYYLQKTAFGASPSHASFGIAPSAPPKMNLLRIEDDLSAAHLRLSRVYIEKLSWSDCVSRWDRDYTLHYLDPPYWETEGYGVDFVWSEYEKMLDLARSIKGRMIISINNHPEIRNLFDGFRMEEIDIKYTVGKSNNCQAKELVIMNW